MIFMALVGGLGTFEGAILGAVVFFAIESVVRRHRRLVSGRPRRDGAGLRACLSARHLGLGRGPHRRCGCCRSATACASRQRRERRRRAEGARRSKRTPGARRGRRLMMLLGKTIVITGISSGIGARVGELAQRARRRRDRRRRQCARTAARRLHQGGHRLSPRACAEIVAAPCRGRFDALCNVAGVSGVIGAAKTLAINFYGLRALTRSAGAAAARGRRRSSMSPRSPATAGAPISSAPRRSSTAPGFPDIAALLAAASRFPTARAIPCRRSSCCCGRCAPRISRCSRSAAFASTRSVRGRWRRRS